MVDLGNGGHALDGRHRAALAWFHDHRGQVVGWPEPLPDGTLLAARPKGIYKPGWTDYALSVRETLGSRYADREPVGAEGTWLYLYHQEGPSTEPPASRYTNAGLLACWRDGVPIGVLREIRAGSRRRYSVLGLARVFNHDAGFFFLEGVGEALAAPPAAAETAPLFDPQVAELIGERTLVPGMNVVRPGQQEFRRKLVAAYGGHCAVTNYDAVPSLQAAHVTPYQGSATDHVQNGLLLRADVHILFDRHLLRVTPDEVRVELAPELLATRYRPLHGASVVLPKEEPLRPSRAALAKHAQACPF